MKIMRKIGLMMATAVLALGVGGCTPAKVSNGYTGVVVNMMGSDKGVDPVEVGVGWKWLTWNEEMFKFPTFNQNFSLGVVKFQDTDGMTLSAPIGVTLRAAPGAAPLLFKTYRKGMNEIINVNVPQVVLSNLNNDAAKLTADKIYSENKQAFFKGVEEKVQQHFAERGLVIESLYITGEIGLPEKIRNRIDAKVEAVQMTIQRQNEVEQVKAEADKIREQAKGEKDASISRAEGEAQSLNIRGEALRKNPGVVELNAIEKWDGKLPTMMGGNSAVPFIKVN